MKNFLFLLLFITVLTAGGIWYLTSPRSFGVSYTSADLDSAYKKLNVVFEPLGAQKAGDKTLIVTGAHAVDETFTSAELTAIANNRGKQYSYFPFRNVQIRVNSDGSVEGAATVSYMDAVNYLMQLGVSAQNIAAGAKKFKIPNAPLPVYLKVSGSVIGNTSNITVSAVQIARIPVPQNFIDDYAPALNTLVNDVILARQPSYSIQKLEVFDGKVHFAGTAPDKEQAVAP